MTREIPICPACGHRHLGAAEELISTGTISIDAAACGSRQMKRWSDLYGGAGVVIEAKEEKP